MRKRDDLNYTPTSVSNMTDTNNTSDVSSQLVEEQMKNDLLMGKLKALQ